MAERTGIVDLTQSEARLRVLDNTFVADIRDPLIPKSLVSRFGLQHANEVTVEVGQRFGPEKVNGKSVRKKTKIGKEQSQAPRVEKIVRIEGIHAGDYHSPRDLRDCTPTDPAPQIQLEYPGCPSSCRLIDLFCPIGFGQRGLIVSPPKAGKTTLLQEIADAIQKNYPEAIVWALLVDERPEEVTDFRRNTPCEVFASSNDHPAERHVGISIAVIERAKRLAESGKDVVILMDSLTRLGRAFNTAPGLANSGKILSGGMDSTALSIPKQLFGAARQTEEAGSLTILASCLIDTGSRGDQLIFEEFKGTGNMEMILDRQIAERRIFPALNLAASGTRKDHLLLDEQTLKTTTLLRRRLSNMKPIEQVEQLLKALSVFKTNDALVGQTASSAA